jgi:hypothetical protein
MDPTPPPPLAGAIKNTEFQSRNLTAQAWRRGLRIWAHLISSSPQVAYCTFTATFFYFVFALDARVCADTVRLQRQKARCTIKMANAHSRVA